MVKVSQPFEERKETDIQTSDAGKHAVQMFYDIKSGKYQQDKINEFYNEMGSTGYDEWAKVVNFTEPFEIIKQVHQAEEEEAIELEKDATLLDVGAGTGVIGKGLYEQGYTKMDALDASEEFQQNLMKLGIYNQVYQRFLGNGVDQYPAELKKKYDCVTASGVFMPNHMPKEAMDDIHATLKTGGYFITAMRGSLYLNGEE